MDLRLARLSPGHSLVIACAFWAAGTVVSKQLLGSVPAVLFLILQLVPSVAALWFFLWIKRSPLPKGRVLLLVLALGWLNPGVSYTLSMLGLVHASASVATLLWAAEPAMIIALAWLFLRERIGLPMLALTSSAAFGVALASGIAAQGAALDGQAYGAALILLGVFCCAVYTVASRDIAASIDPLTVVALQQLAALIWALSIWPFAWTQSARAELLGLDATEIAGGILSGLMYYSLAFCFYLNGLKSMSASRTGNFFNLIPVFGIALAFVFLGERLTPLQWIGAALILGSVASLQRH